MADEDPDSWSDAAEAQNEWDDANSEEPEAARADPSKPSPRGFLGRRVDAARDSAGKAARFSAERAARVGPMGASVKTHRCRLFTHAFTGQ